MDATKLLDFNAQARRIRKLRRSAETAEAAAKCGGEPGLRPAETSQGVLYVECYRYYRRLKHDGKLEALAEHVAGDHRSRWRRHQREGIDNVLRLLERPGKPWLVTPSRRARIVEELSFADRHNIDSKLLLAFLHEAGPHKRLVELASVKDPAAWIARYQQLSKFLRADATKRRQNTNAPAKSVPKQ